MALELLWASPSPKNIRKTKEESQCLSPQPDGHHRSLSPMQWCGESVSCPAIKPSPNISEQLFYLKKVHKTFCSFRVSLACSSVSLKVTTGQAEMRSPSQLRTPRAPSRTGAPPVCNRHILSFQIRLHTWRNSYRNDLKPHPFPDAPVPHYSHLSWEWDKTV